MKHFNGDCDLPVKLTENIRAPFAYRWEKDLSQFIEFPEDKKILEQLPEDIQDSIYRNFLYFEFLSNFQA